MLGMNWVMRITCIPILCIVFVSQGIFAQAEDKTYVVKSVLSGDTIELESGSVISYSSIKAPDMESKDKRIREYAQMAKDYNTQLVLGKTIHVEWGAKIRNEDGIYSPYVFLEDDTLVNQKLLESGFAKLDINPPNFEYAEELRSASKNSRKDSEGLWQYESEVDHNIGVVGDVMTKKFYWPDDPLIMDVPKPHKESFSSAIVARSRGYKPSKEYRERYAQETSLY
ncbi:MAG: endonuclease YncB(thermonuclease family) [Candidatus Omnitrophota bacterium]|jgi:endonuclease YncB( thermonuclease family)